MTISPRELGGTKSRRVLLALLLHRGSPVPKDLLVTLLWEGSPPPGAMATLESYVCVLRKKLQPCHRSRSSLITTTAGCYAIDMSRVDLDLVRYERLLAAALKPGTTAADALPMLQQAMAMAESPLLPEEINCEWLDEERRSHTQSVVRDHVAAADKVARLQSGSAQRWARVALDEDPLDESAWQALLLGMEASGQHAEGLRAYDQCRRLFAAELGCSPGPMLRQQYVRLLQGANEHDDGLTLLFDAVVRLHATSQPGSRPPQWALGDARHDARGQVATIAQARRTLELLLSRVGTDRLPSAAAMGA